MYREVEIDGKIIKIRKEIPIEETGIAIDFEELEDTMELTEVIGEINDK